MTKDIRRDDRPGLYCIELRTQQWERLVEWYREVIGLRVLVRVTDDGYALLEAGETRNATGPSGQRPRNPADQPGFRSARRAADVPAQAGSSRRHGDPSDPRP